MMRFRHLLVAVGAGAMMLTGCGAFSAHPDVVAEAAGQKLTAQRLADIMTSIRAPVAIDVKPATFIANLWTDLTLFAQAAAHRQLKNDSSLVADAMWPQIIETVASEWMDSLVAQRVKVNPGTVDSLYALDTVRSVQHLLVAVDSTAPKEDQELAHKKAEGILARIKAGMPFSQAVVENTDDPGSKADSGFYYLKPKASWDPPFGNALWKLGPGEMSGLVHGHYGYHIIRRPTEAEEKKFWADSLRRAGSGAIINAYYPELDAKYHVSVASSAAPDMRAAVDDLDGHSDDGTAIATYDGGKFTVGDFVKWLRAATANPQTAAQYMESLHKSPDSVYVRTAKLLTESDLIVQEAHKHGVQLRPDQWKAMQQVYSMAVDTLKMIMGLDSVLDSTASVSARSEAAGTRVHDYFDELVAQKTHLSPMPGILAAALRARSHAKFNAIALQRALDIAHAKRTADSLKAGSTSVAPPGGGAAPQGGGAGEGNGAVRPAPNGPPVGSDTGAGKAPAPR